MHTLKNKAVRALCALQSKAKSTKEKLSDLQFRVSCVEHYLVLAAIGIGASVIGMALYGFLKLV